jgi:DNA-binding LacI/PurR family transcriptional regulator
VQDWETIVTSMSNEPGVARRSRPTMKDVATLAGVGIKTVSRVINGEPNVSDATIDRVMRAANILDYQLDVYAGNLRRTDRRTQTIGLLVGNVANPFSGALHRAVEDATHDLGYAVISASLHDDSEREQRLVREFLRRRVDGLVLTTISRSQAYLLAEQERGTPMVFVDREPRGIDADSVVSANVAGASSATAHLVAHGHRSIACLGDRNEISTARLRVRGFLDEIGRAGIPSSEAHIVADLDDEAKSYAAVITLLDHPHPPTALFTAQNLVTIGAVRALRDRGREHDIALVGFDDIALADLVVPGVTVVAQDPEQIGRRAAERLLARIDGAQFPVESIHVPTTLIARGSGEIRPAHRSGG